MEESPLEPERAASARAIGVALVERSGSYLVRLRPPAPGSPMPGVWEFPGGKCEPGESPAQAAVRECREESGLAVAAGALRRRILHEYPHGRVDLHYYDCTLIDQGARAPGGGFVWLPVDELARLRFPEANETVIADLIAGSRAGP